MQLTNLRAALAVALTTAGFIALMAWQRAAPPDVVPVALPVAARASAPPRLPQQAAAGPAPDIARPAALSLVQQVDALVRRATPASLYQAYRLLSECEQFNRLQDRVIFEHGAGDGDMPGMRGMTASEKLAASALCTPMTERMRQSRLDYLAAAARGGVPGSAVQFAIEGPFGDRSALATRPDDPLVRAWQAQASAQLHQAADNNADRDAIHFLLAEYDNGGSLSERNPALAYRYTLALDATADDELGKSRAFAHMFGADSDIARRAAAELTPGQRAAEQAEAQRIASVARARRQREADAIAPVTHP